MKKILWTIFAGCITAPLTKELVQQLAILLFTNLLNKYLLIYLLSSELKNKRNWLAILSKFIFYLQMPKNQAVSQILCDIFFVCLISKCYDVAT